MFPDILFRDIEDPAKIPVRKTVLFGLYEKFIRQFFSLI